MASEKDSLLGRATDYTTGMLNSTRTIQFNGQRISRNRMYIILVLTVLAVFGLYAENQVLFLRRRVRTMTAQVNELEALTAAHETVIERFNQSVSKSEVLAQLQRLEANLTATVEMLHHDLAQTEASIQVKLDHTSDELKSQVVAAEAEINSKVQTVEESIEKYYIETQDQFSMENSFMVYQLAGTFTLLSCLISMWHMTAHLRKLNQPMVQRKILAILWMSPVYAITSWFSLVFPSAEGYLAIIKDGYEAYIIYQFLSFCIAVIGKGDRKQVVEVLAEHADHLTPPFRLTAIFEICGCVKSPVYESNRQLADEILLQCQFVRCSCCVLYVLCVSCIYWICRRTNSPSHVLQFAMQFVFFRPLTTTAMVILNNLHYYGKGTQAMDYRAPQLYITVIQNISIFVAFTGLLKFYHAVDNELQWCRPFAKFLCIKGVVFMTFWQGLAISILAETTNSEAEGWADSAQNFLICLEMLLFSIAHFYCFPTEEWQDGYRVKVSKGKFGDSIALGDFFSDLKMILKKKPRNKKKKLEKLKPPETIEEEDVVTEALSSDDNEEEESETTEHEHSATQSDHDIIISAIHNSLGEDADDPEIVEATRRLLESNVLSPEFFDDEDSVSSSEVDNLLDIEENGGVQLFQDDVYGQDTATEDDNPQPVATDLGGADTAIDAPPAVADEVPETQPDDILNTPLADVGPTIDATDLEQGGSPVPEDIGDAVADLSPIRPDEVPSIPSPENTPFIPAKLDNEIPACPTNPEEGIQPNILPTAATNTEDNGVSETEESLRKTTVNDSSNLE